VHNYPPDAMSLAACSIPCGKLPLLLWNH